MKALLATDTHFPFKHEFQLINHILLASQNNHMTRLTVETVSTGPSPHGKAFDSKLGLHQLYQSGSHRLWTTGSEARAKTRDLS